jgi:hypothetical protein
VFERRHRTLLSIVVRVSFGRGIHCPENGVHNDPYYDFLVGEKKLSDLTPLIINWLSEGFA